jgi:hypothetical protein
VLRFYPVIRAFAWIKEKVTKVFTPREAVQNDRRVAEHERRMSRKHKAETILMLFSTGS